MRQDQDPITVVGQNIRPFIKQNGGEWSYTKQPQDTFEHLHYLQTRLNTCIIYLAAPNLIESLGFNRNDILTETKFLAKICGSFQIPGAEKVASYQI